MTKEEIISGLQFTIDMFLFDPNTGETYTEPRNDMDKTTIDACKGAIELLKQEPILDKITEIIEPLRHLPIGEMSDIEWDILRVIDKYKAESEQTNGNDD